VRVPRAGGPSIKAEPFGAEALQFANRHFLQRDVTLQVENVDKTGGFIGNIFLAEEKDSNCALLLLKNGLASVHDYSASQSSFASQFYAAEKSAQELHIGIWKDFDASAQEKQEEEEAKLRDSLSKEVKKVVVSELSASGTFFLQVLNDGK
jgi:staphylococcal nuclease domain-containing protein 1